MKYPLWICLHFILLILLSSFTYPMGWMRLTSTFGESRGDHLHNGIDIFGADFPVYSVMSGQIVFYWQQSDHPREQMLGYGNYVIMQHADRYRSFYYHLKDGSIPTDLISVSEGQQIGLTGNSGHSAGPHLHFTLVDLKNNVSINPLGLMKELHDRMRPVINKVYYVLDGQKERKEITQNTRIEAGTRFRLLVEAYDRRDNMSNKYGVYIFEIRTNSGLYLRHQFDNLSTVPELTHDKRSSLKFDDVFTSDGLYKAGEFISTKDMEIGVTVGDFNGNTNKIVKKIMVVNTP